MLPSENVNAYLARIGYAGPLEPNAETLRQLQLAHLYAVPFENLDIGLGKPLSLALPALYDKIVTRHRGGFCYELNGLFAALLQTLGFAVTYLSARVANEDGSYGPEFDHLVLQVDDPPGQAWLADVGFGDGLREPLPLTVGAQQAQPIWTYWLEAGPDGDGSYLLWRRLTDGKVEPQIAFTRQPRRFPADYEPMCLWQQTAPESHFVQQRLATLAQPAGRISVSDNRYIVTEFGPPVRRREQPIDEAEFWRLVRDDFHMPMPDPNP